MFNQQRENRKYTIQLHNRPTKEGVVSYLWLHLGHQNGTACYFLRKKMFLPIFNCCELCRIKSSVRRTGDDGWRLLGHFLWPIKAMLTNGCRPLPLSSAAFIFQCSFTTTFYFLLQGLLFLLMSTTLLDLPDLNGQWTCKINVKEWIQATPLGGHNSLQCLHPFVVSHLNFRDFQITYYTFHANITLRVKFWNIIFMVLFYHGEIFEFKETVV